MATFLKDEVYIKRSCEEFLRHCVSASSTTMSIPLPYLRHLDSTFITNDSDLDKQPKKVWEISVPRQDSIFWSILLPYLIPVEMCDTTPLVAFRDNSHSHNQNCFDNYDKFRGEVIMNLSFFNPFETKSDFMEQRNMDFMRKVICFFKLSLTIYGNKVGYNGSDMNDEEIILNRASNMLNCKICVFYPENRTSKIFNPIINPEKKPKIIRLFRYENQENESLTGDIFRFGMELNQAHVFQLLILRKILSSVQVDKADVEKVVQMLTDSSDCNESFLSEVLQNGCYEILPYIYKSPYLTLKLSETGFETDPTKTEAGKPSPLFYALAKEDVKFIRILYDYSANCCYLSDKTIRDADQSVLCSLYNLHDVFMRDRSYISSCNFENVIKERILFRLDYFCFFNEYQQCIATQMQDIKSKSWGDARELYRKTILVILDSYIKYFYRDLPQPNSISEIYDNYLKYKEYYEYLDTFSSLIFFDNIHFLEKRFELNHNIYENIEANFLFLILSNKLFTKRQYEILYDKMQCENDKILQLIPLFYREKLKIDINSLRANLAADDESNVCEGLTEDKNLHTLSSFPEIRDEYMYSRILFYLRTTQSMYHDKIECVLAIEKTLQVLGESLKPQTTEGCIMTYMLKSILPSKTKRNIILIRNKLSHCRDNSLRGRLNAENDFELFTSISDYFRSINVHLMLLLFLTQELVLKEFLIEHCIFEKRQLSQEMKKEFERQCSEELNKAKTIVNDCIQSPEFPLFVILINLENYLHENNVEETDIYASLKSLEYFFKFLLKFGFDDFKSYMEKLTIYIEKYEKNSKIDMQSLSKFIENCKNMDFFFPYNRIGPSFSMSLECSSFGTFLNFLEQSDFVESDIQQIILAVQNACNEAVAAQNDLIRYANESFSYAKNKERFEALFRKLIVSNDYIQKLRKLFMSGNKNTLNKLNKIQISKDSIVEDIRKMFHENSTEKIEIKRILLKITFQAKIKPKIYETVNLEQSLCNKLELFLTKKMQFLLKRVENMKYILIDQDENIKAAWENEGSTVLKRHLKFLMRQRFLKEGRIQASLEMAFFDCLNVLKKRQGDLEELYNKYTNLLTGINLRNVLSHGDCLLENIGKYLDEDDLPSEFINKMLELIEDAEVIKCMNELIPVSNTLEGENFKSFIEGNIESEFKEQIEKVLNCPRWPTYLSLLPLI